MSDGKLDALFQRWLDLRNRDLSSDNTEDENALLGDKMAELSQEILAGKAVTDADGRAQIAMLVECAVNGKPYAIVEAVEAWYGRLIIDRLPSASSRLKERQWSERRVALAREELADQEHEPTNVIPLRSRRR